MIAESSSLWTASTAITPSRTVQRRPISPIKLVRQSAKRERTPEVLELAELQLLLSKLSVRERTLALLDAATGLRVSELLALRWSDVDFENLELRVTRSIWHQVVGNCKNRGLRPNPFRWTATWQRIFCAGAVRVPTLHL